MMVFLLSVEEAVGETGGVKEAIGELGEEGVGFGEEEDTILVGRLEHLIKYNIHNWTLRGGRDCCGELTRPPSSCIGPTLPARTCRGPPCPPTHL